VCEEVWQRLGHSDFVVASPYPEARQAEIDLAAEAAEASLRGTIADIREILKVTGIAAKRITLFTAPMWRADAFALAATLARQGGLTIGSFMERAAVDPELKGHTKELAAFAKKAVEDISRRKGEDLALAAVAVDERAYFGSARDFLAREFGCEVVVHDAGETGVADPRGKARHAMPGRPAISVE
jgi:leucyl-tRNA synthetase